VKTLLLVAGRSQRFWPLSEKTLFPLCGTNLLALTLQRLAAAGVRDVTVVGGTHNLDLVRPLFPHLPTIEQEDLDLGMRGALLSALPSCNEEPTLVVCANDIIESKGYSALLAAGIQKGVSGALLAQRVERYFPGGYLQQDANGRLTGIVEKPGPGKEPSNLMNIVVHIHNHPEKLFVALQQTKGKADGAYERAIGSLLKDHVYRAVPYEGTWQAVKYPWHLLDLLPALLSEIKTPVIHPTVQVHPTAVLDGPIVLGEGVRVFPHATVRGPCVIGAQSVIANNALVRGSSIGEHCVVGFGSEVKSSVLAQYVWTHMSYVGDSVIGSNVSFGGGSMTGNLRLDEMEISSAIQGKPVATGHTKFGTVIGDHCRLGIHTSINPGCKIGAGSFIGSHSLISQDIPDGSFVTTRGGELVIRPNKTPPLEPGGRAAYRSEALG